MVEKTALIKGKRYNGRWNDRYLFDIEWDGHRFWAPTDHNCFRALEYGADSDYSFWPDRVVNVVALTVPTPARECAACQHRESFHLTNKGRCVWLNCFCECFMVELGDEPDEVVTDDEKCVLGSPVPAGAVLENQPEVSGEMAGVAGLGGV